MSFQRCASCLFDLLFLSYIYRLSLSVITCHLWILKCHQFELGQSNMCLCMCVLIVRYHLGSNLWCILVNIKKNARYLSKDVKPVIFVINLDYFTKYILNNILRYNNLLNFFLCKNQIFPKLLKSFQQLAGASLCVLGAPTTRLVKDIQARPSKIVGEEILLTFI